MTGLLFDLTMTSIENLLLQTHLNETTIALNPTSIFQSLSLLPYTGLLGTLLRLQTSSVTLRSVLNKHAPPSLRKVITHSSSPWFESIRDELL